MILSKVYFLPSILVLYVKEISLNRFQLIEPFLNVSVFLLSKTKLMIQKRRIVNIYFTYLSVILVLCFSLMNNLIKSLFQSTVEK